MHAVNAFAVECELLEVRHAAAGSGGGSTALRPTHWHSGVHTDAGRNVPSARKNCTMECAQRSMQTWVVPHARRSTGDPTVREAS